MINDYKNKYIKYKSKYLNLKRQDIDIKFNDLKLDKVLGRGRFGVVYLAIDSNKNEYAVKIQNILPKDITKSFKSSHWREIDFIKNMNNLYPNHFLKLHDHLITKNCEHKPTSKDLTTKLELLPSYKQQFYKKLYASPFCAIKVYSLVDMTLKQLLDNMVFNFDTFYDLFIQIIYKIYLINKHGYFHRDFDSKNIGIKITNNKSIDILNHDIPTHGYLIIPIDYGNILHKKYDLNQYEKELLDNKNDITSVLRFMLIDFDKFNKLNNIEEYDHKELDINDNIKNILKPYLPEYQIDDNTKNILMNVLYRLLFYEDYEKQLLGDKLKEIYPPLIRVPNKIILFMIANYKNVPKILEYVLDNR